jgi:hypothetical protein
MFAALISGCSSAAQSEATGVSEQSLVGVCSVADCDKVAIVNLNGDIKVYCDGRLLCLLVCGSGVAVYDEPAATVTCDPKDGSGSGSDEGSGSGSDEGSGSGS